VVAQALGGGGYAWIPSNSSRPESGYSPTEDEFNEAVRLGKPIFVLKQQTDMSG
jgi:hypothetical protein